MARRKKKYDTKYGTAPAGQVWLFDLSLNNRNVSSGTKLKFKGERGDFSFIKYVERDQGKDWIDVFDKNGQFRAFYADRLKTVKNKTKREKAAANAK